MKYRVDQELCAGHGRCWTVATTVYEADDNGFASPVGELITVAAGLEDIARRGARSCPEGAIEVFDD
ncbi:ferredoxin [Nocardia sp. NPDC004123]